MQNKKFWQFKNTAEKKGELSIYGPISTYSWWDDVISPKQFKKDLDALGEIDELDIYINSSGGDVFAGQTIYSIIKRHNCKKTVHVDGLAASIASVIACAGDIVHMPANAMIMIHNPWTYSYGNAEEFRKLADDLDKIRESIIAVYEAKSTLNREEIIKLMDDETWMTAEEAKEYGFADEIEEEKEIAASLDGGFLVLNGTKMDFTKYKNSPKFFIPLAKKEPEMQKVEREVPLFALEKLIELNEKRYKEDLT